MDVVAASAGPVLRKIDTRLVLIGKTGTGKSALSNILLQKEVFAVDDSMSSGTTNCAYDESMDAWGRRIQIVDTPGLFDTERDLPHTLSQLTDVMSLSAPGPHAVLFLINLDAKFTEEEHASFSLTRKMFEGVEQHLIVVFTRGEKAKGNIAKFLENVPASLKEALRLAGNRYATFNFNDDKREEEVRSLLETVDLVSNNGTKFYTNNDIQKMGLVMAPEVEKIMKKRQMTYEKAERYVKQGLAGDLEEFWTLKKKLLLIGVCSVAFAVLGGIAGAVVGVYFAEATVAEAITSAAIPTAVAILEGGALIAKRVAQKHNITCVVS